MNVPFLVGLGQRPTQKITVVTRDGQRFDLGRQVSGDDAFAWYHQWRQRRKIAAYCRARLRTLSGDERLEFLKEMEGHRG